jgi:hypothetical protein
MPVSIKAIETRYAGCRFRSRLEARWAVFFDSLGISWEYEPQGFELTPLSLDQIDRARETHLTIAERTDEHLGYYLPDFWLPKQELWLEIKGVTPPEQEYQRIWRFCELTGQRVMIAIGSIPDPRTIDSSGHLYDGAFDIEVYGDFHYAWTRCRICGFYDVTFDARSARTCCRCHAYDCSSCNGDKCYNGDDPAIIAAYTAARSARFEHGESGA